MLRYVSKRILVGVATLFVLIAITFFLVRCMPGNPFLSDNISQDTVETLMQAYRLDQPVGVQFAAYLRSLARGDLGASYKKPSLSVNTIIHNAMPATFSLGALAFVVSSVSGILLGVWQAASKNRAVQGALLAVTTVGISMPSFIVATLLMMLFGIRLKLFSIVGLYSASHYVLPVLSLSLYPATTIARLVNTSYAEAMGQDFVLLARAKGLGDRAVAFRHVLQHTMTPVIIYMGQSISFLLTGSFVVENIFTIPGLGMEFVNSIQNRDYTVIMGLTIFMGAVVIAANLVADIICSFIDPRLRIQNGGY